MNKYSSTIYAFDIETTTINEVVTHYLSSFISVDFGIRNKPINEIIDQMSEPAFMRTPAEINDFLVNLNEKAKKEKKRVLIYVFNLAYEFTFLINNIKFVRDNFKNSKTLFIKRRVPLFVKLDYIEFRCCYKLLNKSLSKCGENIGIAKQSIDYDNKYFSFSELPDYEYEYNKTDVIITLAAVLKECSLYDWLECVDDIPLTSTSFTRKNDIAINTRSDRIAWSSACNYQKNFSIDYINFLEKIFCGGYTHANAHYVAQALENVSSMDIVSSYIDTILHRQYPSFFKECKIDNKVGFLKKLLKNNTTDYMEVIKNYQKPFNRAFLACVTLINVQAKKLKNDNLILPLSLSKCEKFKGVKQDNGRVYSAKLITTNINEVDYFCLSLFYDFELVDCTKLYYTRVYKELPNFVTNSTRSYLREKSTLKDILHKIENGEKINKTDFFNANIGDYIYQSEQINAILSSDDMKDIIEDNYRAAKNKLNACYGKNVQKLITPNIIYDVKNDEYIVSDSEKIEAKYLMRDFTKGLYITSYSRLNLFCFGMYLIENTETALIYSDTDSWKCYGDLKNVKRVNVEYNKLIESIVYNSEDYNIGYFDYEAEYKYFSTLGCKKYIFSYDGDGIKSTIAGVNKKKSSKAFTELFKRLNYDFPLLCSIAFSPCTILDYSIIEKLITKYHNNEYDMIVTDENGKSGNIRGVNMVELCKSDYVLMDSTKLAITEFINHINTLQGIDLNITPTKIYRNSSGEVDYKYIINWNDEVNAIRGESVEHDKQIDMGVKEIWE